VGGSGGHPSNLLFQGATDGVYDGFLTLQGVRSFDPGNASWTTPDAFAGITHDPMSQKSYMYDGNNPIVYSDPTGFYVFANNSPGNADFNKWAADLTTKVQQCLDQYAKSGGKDPAVISRYKNLLHDLKPNTPGWKVDTSAAAVATMLKFSSTADAITWPSGDSTFDTSTIKSEDRGAETVLEEGGLHEEGRNLTGAVIQDTLTSLMTDDRHVDHQIQTLYGTPILHEQIDDSP
jgi:RHS repeat-associated protein